MSDKPIPDSKEWWQEVAQGLGIKLFNSLNKTELELIYKFLETTALPYDNYELHLAVEKLRRIVETNELDK